MEISKLMKRSLAEACGTTNKQQTQIMFSSCKIDTTKFNWLLVWMTTAFCIHEGKNGIRLDYIYHQS